MESNLTDLELAEVDLEALFFELTRPRASAIPGVPATGAA